MTMLHIAEVTHGPDTCPINSPEAMAKVKAGFGETSEIAGKLGASIQGDWTNMPAHALWFIIDAPQRPRGQPVDDCNEAAGVEPHLDNRRCTRTDKV